MIIEMKKQNDKPLTDEEAILKKLRINDIAEITKKGLKKLSSLHIDPEVLKKLIEQIPHFSELAKAVMHDYSLSFQKVLESDTASQAYSDACRSMLESGDLNSDQKLKILEDMKEMAREKREHFARPLSAVPIFTRPSHRPSFLLCKFVILLVIGLCPFCGACFSTRNLTIDHP